MEYDYPLNRSIMAEESADHRHIEVEWTMSKLQLKVNEVVGSIGSTDQVDMKLFMTISAEMMNQLSNGH